ncbi:cytochrome-c oxidase, cbb3-type subunit II [Magnetospirillum sp. UT-4]|uniref:cytochrome-c oxidase, cbb3-type subunit II n=1 Tax=Magnetospirillum sp. UT-4 TaxID=2681467 RepID=UPI00137EFF0C|nr:cytochrome-c oxidase, cbb3-type subunit II [Magnetospirillum sp. UT-4]CAA7615339.1 Cytochrome C oxidase, mono-heme subunit/FixO [Magnetospirillum sp. UT-4]
MSVFRHHAKLETNVFLLAVGILLTVITGGLIEIVPLFTIESTIEKVQGVRPYSPLEQAGRNIYVREGCYLCHSQMVRPFKDEIERYGHYSLAAESKYDHPFQWGSKRTGPDLARVGGKYTNDWHVRHMINPRDVVPESVMPGYPHLMRPLSFNSAPAHLQALKVVGVPYSDEQIRNAKADLLEQADPAATEASGVVKRYPNAKFGDFDGDPKVVSEMDALVAYLQVLGTMVDFTTVKPEKIYR